MKNWTRLGTADIPGSPHQLYLYRDKDDFHISLGRGGELMSTRKHGSEDALGRLPCERLSNADTAHALIGGLGMGFTLAAVLASLGPGARVMVAELIPEVVEWNSGALGQFSGFPLKDPRTEVFLGDVATVLRTSRSRFDVIALDVDNGPEGLTSKANDWLYSAAGIHAAQLALRPGGVLAYWSAGHCHRFQERLRGSGMLVDEVSVFAHGNKGARHTIWLAS